MSTMERRLQLLLDQHRYDLVAAEAARSGRSVAAVIREAIDRRFDDADQRRMAAAARLLEMTEHPEPGAATSLEEAKKSIGDELEEKYERIGRQ
jgi:hypothetical protein